MENMNRFPALHGKIARLESDDVTAPRGTRGTIVDTDTYYTKLRTATRDVWVINTALAPIR